MAKRSHTSKPNPEKERSYLSYYGLAFELVILNAGLILGGYFLDAYLTTSPLFILAGTLLAMAGTIWILLNKLK